MMSNWVSSANWYTTSKSNKCPLSIISCEGTIYLGKTINTGAVSSTPILNSSTQSRRMPWSVISKDMRTKQATLLHLHSGKGYQATWTTQFPSYVKAWSQLKRVQVMLFVLDALKLPPSNLLFLGNVGDWLSNIIGSRKRAKLLSSLQEIVLWLLTGSSCL